jgi:hypothetical protein
VFWFCFRYVLNSNTSLSLYLFCSSRIHVITLYSGHACVYYAAMLRCWHLVWILVRTDNHCLGVGCHSIKVYRWLRFYLDNWGEAVDKAHKQPIAHTRQTSIIQNIHHKAFYRCKLITDSGKTPNEYGSRRGSGCSLLAHPLLLGLRGWLTKCRCQMRRGHWLHQLPSSSTL